MLNIRKCLLFRFSWNNMNQIINRFIFVKKQIQIVGLTQTIISLAVMSQSVKMTLFIVWKIIVHNQKLMVILCLFAIVRPFIKLIKTIEFQTLIHHLNNSSCQLFKLQKIVCSVVNFCFFLTTEFGCTLNKLHTEEGASGT